MSAAVVTAVVLAACSSSGQSGSKSDSSSNSSQKSSTAAKGTPIKVMQIVDVTSPAIPEAEIAEAGKATVKDINASGGISGHPIELAVCNAQGDPNQTAACGRKAVSSKVVAVVGEYTSAPASLTPILTAAKIPLIPAYPFAPVEFSPPAYAITSGFVQIAGLGVMAAKYCSSSVIAAADFPGIEFNVGLVNQGLKLGGKPAAKAVKIPLTPGDFTSQATQIKNTGAKCVINLTSVGEELSLFPALKAAGSSQRILGAAGTVTAGVFKKTALASNAYIVDSFVAYSGSKWDAYRALTKKYSNPSKYDFSNSGARSAYVDFLAFKQVVQTLLAAKLDVTAANVIATLNKTTALNTGGLLPTLNLTQAAPVKGFSQAFGRGVTFEVVKNGNLVSLDNDTFHDVTPVMQAVAGK